ncbi:zinc ABC transporter permease subunit ZnuB [Ectothiorhodospira lacustris]|uniref:zinc ABC transporter permease subunit ZnuB n=1 Tax=Ectothiorhodospira lacustris TaxID=2899127 RepID=UPI001EE82624|nr:zinc ABC transporter permease subunit ZnuB [Ectothiorhodospira lacustris]MCG5499955.1 zinc ABC transporter permease subunit ZnuB [Ectothiorhodospira lacustris]MCG5508874.1 zinc ABC transporter permease subunit ZnuB [Ectothiorhodospira lacustris]MCG5520665.1 zinc ABC transporter permease subunit ZnuB [Ectothiorhodospira lacustris]
MDDFIVRALIGGMAVAVVAGPLGSFVVWRRMAYFGDTLAHSALLGVALGFLIGLNVNLTVIILCVALALVLMLLQRQRRLATDTVLGILAHSSLSLGLVAVAFLEGVRIDLMAYLFGDILAVSHEDLIGIFIGGALALGMLAALWRPLLAMTVHEDLARVEGVRVTLVSMGFMLLMALVIAVAMKVVGILLITSLMIIPAAAARRLSSTPEQMALFAALIGCLAVAGGLWGSLTWDTPAGPSIVVAAALLFAVIFSLPGIALLRRLRTPS